MLEDIDGDLVRGFAIRESDDTHQTGHLSDGDVDGRSGHEGGDGGQGDELDDPSAANQADEEDDGTSQDGEGRGDLIARNVGFLLLRLEDNITEDGGCHGHRLWTENAKAGQPGRVTASSSPSSFFFSPPGITYPDGDIFGGSEEPIDQDTHKGRIKAVFRGELGEGGVGHGLWDDDGTDGDTSGRG